MNKKEILKFIKASILWLKKEDCGCCHYYLDDDLGIFVGWSLGYDPDDPAIIHSRRDPEYAIEAGVKLRRPGDETDYDWLDSPWNSENHCIINCFLPTPEMTDAEYLKEISMLLKSYKETVKGHKKGLVRYHPSY